MEYNGKNYISMKEFLIMTGMMRRTAKKYIKTGILQGFNIGRKYWILDADLTAKVDKQN